MHAVSQSLHRAPATARARARWQPYNAFSVPSRSPPTYLITPASSVSSSPQSSRTCEFERCVPPAPQLQPSMLVRDAQKTKYVIGLVDQAVKCLCEIWKSRDIPSVFLTSSRATVTLPTADKSSITPMGHPSQSNVGTQKFQLPSPISPTSKPSPISAPSSIRPNQDRPAPEAQNNLVPLKNFVHEVLRRSRTTGAVLQTALCYLEAIRSKVPELVKQESLGQGIRGEPDLAARILKTDDGGIAVDSDGDLAFELMIDVEKCGSAPASFQDNQNIESNNAKSISPVVPPPPVGCDVPPARDSKSSASPLPPLPPLPSPLLCPRRAFLASLILASKFTQDRCYSNRAWAKLSGLPPREIGRCERALGDALQWRLWVGKKTPALTPVPAGPTGRLVVRCRSEGDLQPTLKGMTVNHHNTQRSSEAPSPTPSALASRGLRRWSTLPADAFRGNSCHGRGSEVADIRPSTTDYVPSRLMWNQTTSSAISNHSSYGSYPSHAALRIPPTPALTESPSSAGSGSSGGSRTIQMSTFMDVTTPPNGCTTPFALFGDKASPVAGCRTAVPAIARDDTALYACRMDALRGSVQVVMLPDSLISTIDTVRLY